MVDIDVAVVGAGFSGLYMLHRLRGLGLRVRVFERAPTSAARGSGTATRVPAVTSRASTTATRSPTSCSPTGLDGAVRRPAGDPALPPPRRGPLRPAPRHPVSAPGSRRRVTTKPRNRWLVSTDARRGGLGPLLRAGRRATCPRSKRPDFPGLETFRGEWYHTAPWPAGGVDFRGQRVGDRRDRVHGDPGAARRSRSRRPACTSSSARRTTRMPARNRPLPPGRAARGPARVPPSGAGPPSGRTPACPWPRRSGRRSRSPARSAGGCTRPDGSGAASTRSRTPSPTSSPTSGPTSPPRSSPARRSAQIVHDPAVAEALCPAHHIGTKRTCVDIGYFETYNRDQRRAGRRAQRHRSTAITPRGLATDRPASTGST